MKAIDTTLAWLFPKALIEGTPWAQLWEEKERQSFIAACNLVFPIIAIGYLAHIFFYDIANNLSPIEYWIGFRVAIAFLAVSGWATTIYLKRSRFYRLPAIVVYWTVCQSQAVVALVHGLESWVFCFILDVAAVSALRMSALNSLVFVGITILTQSFVLVDAGIGLSYIFTGSLVAAAMTLIVRAPYKSEIQNFLLDQTNIASQKKIIELNIEFAERIRAFIPDVIARRIEHCIDKRGMSVVEASIDVMQPKRANVACLFSDIRGFTENSKNQDRFLENGVLPEVRAGTEKIEQLDGIPRKIGDLIFAYFDDRNDELNLARAALSAFELSKTNRDMNLAEDSVAIKRFVLLSFGEAIVGNLGGSNSSIEITALGSPVNLLSRVDEVTKELDSLSLVQNGDIITTTDFSDRLLELVPSLDASQIRLCEIGINIRNFPEVRSLTRLEVSEANYIRLVAFLDAQSDQLPEKLEATTSLLEMA